MYKKFKSIWVLLGLFLCFNLAEASQPTTFLGPTIKGGYTDSLANVGVYSVAGEVGVNNYRVSGTFGWQLQQNQRLKVTGEYLSQNINYSFNTGNTQQWVNQDALGLAYEYLYFNHPLKPLFNLTGYYSHAPNKNVNVALGRISGSNAGGIAPGVTIQPWQGGKAGLDVNYDKVVYSTYNGNSSKNANGIGATAKLDQALMNHLNLGLVAGVRQPFNNYQANLNWAVNKPSGEWLFGLGAEYNDGKNNLPNSYNIMASVNFIVDHAAETNSTLAPIATDDLKRWVSTPAVRMPQVLAIANNAISACGVGAPAFLSAIASQVFGASGSFATANHFSGGGVTYTITRVTPFTNPSNTVTINATTGVVSVKWTAAPDIAVVTVTATNCAGSVTSNPITLTIT